MEVRQQVANIAASEKNTSPPSNSILQGLQVPAAAAQLTKVLAGLRHTFVVADATLPDMPLVFASEGCVEH